MYKIISSCASAALLFITFMPATVAGASLTDRLSGRILLQVEENGEAWYMHPADAKRYYLGRPSDAFLIMRERGIGISNTDIARMFSDFRTPVPGDAVSFSARDLRLAQRLRGRIILQVETSGEAYYLHPLTLRGYYLGRPADAFRIMREQGLGISNADLALIPVAESSPLPAVSLAEATMWRFFGSEPDFDYLFLSFSKSTDRREVSGTLTIGKTVTTNGASEGPKRRRIFAEGAFTGQLDADEHGASLAWTTTRDGAGNARVRYDSTSQTVHWDSDLTFSSTFDQRVTITGPLTLTRTLTPPIRLSPD